MSLPRAFQEGIQAALDKRQRIGQTFDLAPAVDKSVTVDFASNDTLSLVSSGSLREETLRELDRNPGFEIGACGSRVNEGTPYVAELEKYLAHVHGAEDGLFFVSGYSANGAIFGTLPRHGDAIIYDSLVHASIHDGMKLTRASIRSPFAHNDLHSLANEIENVKQKSPAINSGDRTVFVAIESVYGMDGDVAPAREIVDVVKKALPHQNFILIIDEAHSNGLLGPRGSGLVSDLGLEKEYAVRLQVVGKAHGASGAIVLCDPLVKKMLLNYARMFIFTAAPGFLLAATVKSAYNILTGPEGDSRRRKLQDNIRFFYDLLEREPRWHQAREAGFLRVTSGANWRSESFITPIVPFVTKVGKCTQLRDTLRRRGFLVHGVRFPAVPKDSERVRIVIHAENTKEQMTALVKAIIDWASSQMREGVPSSSESIRSHL
ncbi:pyridoxal phosphate-dependent transferase [Aspergillus novoparasiticus]|uniref:Pyridoxal phosphate-dependent transferase n=1 Tax=Aspergillus novoparasiticus TaxID=986946 RepID=A0A5N6EI13_9EURO|nr:pyridoxal phosphate-dependent transferase [Aspergillus novoparasiticus]